MMMYDDILEELKIALYVVPSSMEEGIARIDLINRNITLLVDVDRKWNGKIKVTIIKACALTKAHKLQFDTHWTWDGCFLERVA